MKWVCSFIPSILFPCCFESCSIGKADEEEKETFGRPTNISIARGTLSVAILVVASGGVDIWVALRFSYH